MKRTGRTAVKNPTFMSRRSELALASTDRLQTSIAPASAVVKVCCSPRCNYLQHPFGLYSYDARLLFYPNCGERFHSVRMEDTPELDRLSAMSPR